MLNLKWGISFQDLNSLSGLSRLDKIFLQYINEYDSVLFQELKSYRNIKSTNLEKKKYSEFIINIAPLLDDFLAELFDISPHNQYLRKKHKQFDVIYECRRKFIQRYAIKKYSKEDLKSFDLKKITNELKELLGVINEKSLSSGILKWQTGVEKYSNQLELAAKYCAFMVHNNSTLALFDVPKPTKHIRQDRIDQLRKNIYVGFDYRDQENTIGKAYLHAKYCIFCHKQGKDSCSHGMQKKDSHLNGCPLKQKISEMNVLKSQGFNIAALAVIVIDNPLVAATGHRICNDCMKSCIYQKQDPVNVPLIESNILEQVLSLPWGVEIYLLLSKWNPLNIDDPLPKAKTGHNIVVTGLGPAGFALSHYLLCDGHNVQAIDGLKISPLHFDIKKPVRFWNDIQIPLSQKLPQGFGGVAEYGITSRWDKNNLTLVRLMLERFESFKINGGVRLGSNITTKQLFDLGFDHIALCLGAGKPNFMHDASYFAKGVRSAADFLMNLQQGGSYLSRSNSNLLVRFPAVVIGCGLTAIDSAVELLHYYPTQVEKFYRDWKIAKNQLSHSLSDEDKEIAKEFIAHAELFQSARNSEEKLHILNKLGGVTICYRKNIEESPAYRLNSEEIEHAMAIGVQFKEYVLPKKLHIDKYGAVESIALSDGTNLKAKSILIAIGTEKNDFQDINNLDEMNSTIFQRKDKMISYFGDCNQKYAGSVVKALSSAKNGYKYISETLLNKLVKKIKVDNNKIHHDLKSYVHKINILSNSVTEIIIYSPFCAKNFQAGQFFKLQNYSSNPDQIIEPIALTGISVDNKANLISFIVLNSGKSTAICKNLLPKEEVVLMGPTGMPTKIEKDKKVILVGSGIGNVTLIPIAKALKENNCHITYFANYKKQSDRFYIDEIKQLSDQVIWSSQETILPKSCKKDLSIKGNLIDSITQAKEIGLIENADRVICMISKDIMQAISAQRKKLFGSAKVVYSLNSPMQCMMKGICGQCIQKTNDQDRYIFSCICQDQDVDIIDFNVLQNRLGQNSLLEKVSQHKNHF